MFYAISNREMAAFERLAIEQLKIDLPLHLVKKGNARAEQHRMSIEDYFIYEVGFEEAFREFAPTKDGNSFSLFRL